MTAALRWARLMPYTAVGIGSLLFVALMAAVAPEQTDTLVGTVLRAALGILVLPAYLAGLIGTSVIGFVLGPEAGSSWFAVYGSALAVFLLADGIRHLARRRAERRDGGDDGA